MQCICDTREFKIEEPTVVTIGKFDGRHRGHQKLLGNMLQLREQYGYKTAVFSFQTAPASCIQGIPATVITTNEERRIQMEAAGIDYLIEYPFSKEVSQLSPEDFVKDILVGQMNARAIVVGTDCGFGYQRAGNAELLEKLSGELGYQLVVVEKKQDHHRDISSTYVKEELDRGNMEKANELLGEPYSIHGTVVYGNQIGGTVLGFPTANLLLPKEKHLPPFGVYVSLVTVDGMQYGGITNIGKKPTIEGEFPVGAETYLLDFAGDLYGKQIEVQLLHFQRPERKFGSLEELRAQLCQDKEAALAYLENYYESRHPKIHNIRNFRDLGGYRNRYGEYIRKDCIFRGASLDKVTEEEMVCMEQQLGIRYILDYRDEEEASLAPDLPFPNAVRERISALLVQDAVKEGFDFGSMMKGEMTLEKLNFMVDYVRDGYRSMPFDNPAYHRLFELLLRGDGHVYFHCTAGKDRTGVASFLIMMALGIREEDAMQDYLLSNQYLRKFNESLAKQLKIPEEIKKLAEPLLYVQKENLMTSIEAIKERYASYEAFLEQEYGLDEGKRKQLRVLYCE